MNVEGFTAKANFFELYIIILSFALDKANPKIDYRAMFYQMKISLLPSAILTADISENNAIIEE